VLVASALMAVALVVLLGSLSSLLIGSRVAERRTVEERLARNQIESLTALRTGCPVPAPTPPAPTPTVDGVIYKVETTCPPPQNAGYVELKVTVHELRDPTDLGESLSIDRVQQ
jgi:hypothetical protein